MISYADTEEMKEVSKQLNALAKELDETFNALYARLSAVPTETKEWVGRQAEFYFDTISNDKGKLNEVSERLKTFSSEIEKQAIQLESVANNLNGN